MVRKMFDSVCVCYKNSGILCLSGHWFYLPWPLVLISSPTVRTVHSTLPYNSQLLDLHVCHQIHRVVNGIILSGSFQITMIFILVFPHLCCFTNTIWQRICIKTFLQLWKFSRFSKIWSPHSVFMKLFHLGAELLPRNFPFIKLINKFNQIHPAIAMNIQL